MHIFCKKNYFFICAWVNMFLFSCFCLFSTASLYVIALYRVNACQWKLGRKTGTQRDALVLWFAV